MHHADRMSLPDRCDVAIVGAGPAGSTAALLFARAGLDVVLLDRATFPRAKPCGDCLSPQASHILERLGLLAAVLAAAPARLAGWRIVAPHGHAFEGRFRDFCTDPLSTTALAISRARFDALLLAAARGAGARVCTEARVTAVDAADTHSPFATLAGRVEHEPFCIAARLIVGADGLRSVVARRIGAPARPAKLRKISLTAHLTGIPGPAAIGEMHVADGLCLGLAPVTAPGRAPVYNVTIVADSERFGSAIAADPAGFFRRASAAFPSVGERLERAVPAVAEPGGPGRAGWLLRSGPFDAPMRRAGAGRVVLVGDAAGYYDPFTGQGIHQALAGAELLAETVAPALLGRAPLAGALARYGRALRAQIRGLHRMQRMIEFVTSRPRLADRVFEWLAVRPAAVHALLAATGDLAPPSSLVRPAPWVARVRNGRRGVHA